MTEKKKQHYTGDDEIIQKNIERSREVIEARKHEHDDIDSRVTPDEEIIAPKDHREEVWDVPVGGQQNPNFGGGTANLTPRPELERLGQVLASSFDVRESEATLESVPRYLLLRDEALLDVLAGMDVGHRRISMGVQTFDPEWLRRMGRDVSSPRPFGAG